MLRWIMPCLVAVFAIGTTDAADGPNATKRAAYAPPANCRRACRAPTTITAPPSRRPRPPTVRRGRQLVIVGELVPDVLFTPSIGFVPYIPPLPGVP